MERRLMAASWLLLSFYALASAWLATARRLSLPIMPGNLVVVEHHSADRSAPMCSASDATPTVWPARVHGGAR